MIKFSQSIVANHSETAQTPNIDQGKIVFPSGQDLDPRYVLPGARGLQAHAGPAPHCTARLPERHCLVHLQVATLKRKVSGCSGAQISHSVPSQGRRPTIRQILCFKLPPAQVSYSLQTQDRCLYVKDQHPHAISRDSVPSLTFDGV